MNVRHNESSEPAPRKSFNLGYRLETYRGKDMAYRFRVVSVANGQIVALGEGYARKKDMLATVVRLFPDAEIHEVED